MKRSMEVDDLDVMLFWIHLDRACLSNLTPNFHYSECYGFDGPVIATCLESAQKLLKLPTPNPKIFFIEDLEWMRLPQKQYEHLYSIYANPQFKYILCRSEEHKKIIENAWNIKVHDIINGYDFFHSPIVQKLNSESISLYSNRDKVKFAMKQTNLLGI